MRRIGPIATCGACALLGLAQCNSPAPARSPASKPVAAAAAQPDPVIERGTERLIRLPEVEADLPPGPGREAVAMYCGMCHSQAYNTLQPPLSREAWTAVVNKMRTTYSGPIPEEKVGEIVDYLVSIRGQESK